MPPTIEIEVKLIHYMGKRITSYYKYGTLIYMKNYKDINILDVFEDENGKYWTTQNEDLFLLK